MMKINHLNILKFYGIYEDAQFFYLVLQYYSTPTPTPNLKYLYFRLNFNGCGSNGRSLLQKISLLKQKKKKKEGLKELDILGEEWTSILLKKIFLAVAYLHEINYVHKSLTL